MSRKKHRFYVVWVGRTPGIYQTWNDAREQVLSYPGACYKGFDSYEQALRAFEMGYERFNKEISFKEKTILDGTDSDERPVLPSICVDAACSGNPGPMEYQGVMTDTKETIFHQGPFPMATNSIGEFLAIVHALAWLDKNHLTMPVYSDSSVAITWVLNKEVKTTLPRNEMTEPVFNLIERAITWLKNFHGQIDLRKWKTDVWGEIPADFDRK